MFAVGQKLVEKINKNLAYHHITVTTISHFCFSMFMPHIDRIVKKRVKCILRRAHVAIFSAGDYRE